MNVSIYPLYHLANNEKIALTIFNVCSMALGLFGNIIVVTLLQLDRNSRGIPSTIILRSLAVSDILVIILVQPLYVYSFFHTVNPDVARAMRIMRASRWALVLASLLHLLVVSVDRFLAICKPNLYHQKLRYSCRWCFIVLVIVWCFTIALGTSLILVPEKTTRVIYKIVFVLCFMVVISLILIHIRLFAVARRHFNQIKKEHAVKGFVSPMTSIKENEEEKLHKEKENLRKHHFSRLHVTFFHDLKAFKTTSIVCGAFLLSWLPLLLFGLVYVTTKNMNDKKELLTMLRIFPYVNTLAFFNCAQNPFIYSVKLRNFRESLQTLSNCVFSSKTCKSKPQC